MNGAAGTVRALEITRYYTDGRSHTTETVLEPTWERLELELSSMHRFEKPILWLLQDPSVPDANVLTVCGGEGAYFVQIATADSDWLTVLRPDGTRDEVTLWTSDQGFTTEAQFVWALGDALEIVRWYFRRGAPHPSFDWY